MLSITHFWAENQADTENLTRENPREEGELGKEDDSVEEILK